MTIKNISDTIINEIEIKNKMKELINLINKVVDIKEKIDEKIKQLNKHKKIIELCKSELHKSLWYKNCKIESIILEKIETFEDIFETNNCITYKEFYDNGCEMLYDISIEDIIDDFDEWDYNLFFDILIDYEKILNELNELINDLK